MKVLSIKEPFATLICKGDKTIETRSWKTNYRGEILIHASGKSLAREYLINPFVVELIGGMKFNYGNIICKCELVDCIHMDEVFIDSIKKNTKEYNLGLYELGRYAWILKNVQPIVPISVKGKLNLWNYDWQYKLVER